MLNFFERLSANKDRITEFRALRLRFTQSLKGVAVDTELEELARALLALRRELACALGTVKACGGCVRPRSREWPGGHCCSGSMHAIFTRDELAALRLIGAKLSRPAAPREPPSGCVFRSRTGCTLAAEYRPSLCVRYTCRELEAELAARGDRREIARIQTRLRIAFEEFSRALNARESSTLD